jgi:hypothetical protein
VERAFKSALEDIGVADRDGSFLERYVIGDGLLLAFIWSEGNAVLKWDGLESIDVNMFVNQENSTLVKDFQTNFLDQFEYLVMVAQDFFPRGYNKVVNFHHEMADYIPHWIFPKTKADDDYFDADADPAEYEDCNEDDDDYECIYYYDDE